MSSLPAGWGQTTIGEVCQVIRGVTFKKGDAVGIPAPGYLPILRATNIDDGRLMLEAEMTYVPERFVHENQRLHLGDVVVATSSGSASVVGKSAQLRLPWEGSFGAFCGAIRPHPLIAPAFLAHFVSSPSVRDQWRQKAQGTNINNLKVSDIASTQIPMPTLAEQRRIVAAIEEHFSRLDAGIAAVNRAKRNVVHLRISHLQDLLAHTAEPVVRISDITNSIQYGYTAKASQSPIGPKMLRITDIQDGRVDWKAVPHCQIEPANLDKYLLAPGDLVFARTGATVGKSYLIRDSQEAVFASYLIRLRFQERVLPEYVALFFQSHEYWRQVTDGSLGIGQPNVNATTLGKIQLRLPGTDQQGRTINAMREIDLALDELMRSLNNQVRRSQKMRSSILAAAFSGRLVSRDPSEITTSVLLDDILAGRSTSDEPTTEVPKVRRAKVKG